MIKETVKLNYLHVAPRKVRLIANAIKGLSANEAEAQLALRPQRSSDPLLKLLRSAIANAKHNKQVSSEKLMVESIQVNQGPVFKRFLPRAMGRATPLHKKTSHVILTLKEVAAAKESRFNIVTEKPKSVKKEKHKKEKKSVSAKPEVKKESGKSKERFGFIKKMFQRKSV